MPVLRPELGETIEKMLAAAAKLEAMPEHLLTERFRKTAADLRQLALEARELFDAGR